MGQMRRDYLKTYLPHELDEKPDKKNYPKVIVRVLSAMKDLDGVDPQGTSRQACYKWVGANYPGTSSNAAKKCLSQCVDSGLLTQPSAQRFRLTDEGRAYTQKKG